MKHLRYGLLYGLLKGVALLPLGVLYVFADVLYILIYRIVRYRRRIVRANLSACFPDMDADALRGCERKFYRNFADYIVETIKLLHISDAEMASRMTFERIDVIDRLVAAGRSVVVYFSHCGNWEWGTSMTRAVKYGEPERVVYAQVYRPLSSEPVDRLMLKIRSRFGSRSFTKRHVLRALLNLRKEGLLSVTGFMSDQKPGGADSVLPLLFLRRPTAFIAGTEDLARRLGFAAVYWDMEKTGRGRYRLTCREITENAALTEPGEITRAYARMLEQTIKRNPSIWLWTHNRWKNPVTLPLQ